MRNGSQIRSVASFVSQSALDTGRALGPVPHLRSMLPESALEWVCRADVRCKMISATSPIFLDRFQLILTKLRNRSFRVEVFQVRAVGQPLLSNKSQTGYGSNLGSRELMCNIPTPGPSAIPKVIPTGFGSGYSQFGIQCIARAQGGGYQEMPRTGLKQGLQS